MAMPSNLPPGVGHYGLVKMCLCHIRKTRSVIVPWTHIQPCPGHIYNCALDTFYKRVVDTFKYVSLPHLYMEKRQKIDTFQALTRLSNHNVEETCEDFGNYICSVN